MSVVCLIRLPAVESFRFVAASVVAPLGLAYVVAAAEKAGRKVHVIDAVGEAPTTITRYVKGYCIGLSLADIVERIPRDVLAVGISVIFTHEWPEAARLVDLIKAARPDLRVILGGEHVTSMPEFCLATSKADILVLGEGEETFVDVLAAIDRRAPLDDIPGIAFRTGANIRVNPRRARRTDVDAIPWPAWNHFNICAYHENRFVGGMYSAHLTMPILATRGCPYQCTYCSSPNMWTTRWIPRSPAKVVDEIQHYVTTYGARNFPFQDLTAIIQKSWIVAFCREIIDRKLDVSWQFPTGTRCEAIDAEVAALLKRSNMTNMAFAPESGSEITRRLIKKKMKTEGLFRSIDAAAAADLNVSVFTVIGFPHDRPEHLTENLPFIDRLADRGVTDLSIGFYVAYPGSELFHSLYDSGCLHLDRAYFRHILDSLALFPSQSHCAALTRVTLALWKCRMFLRFYGAKGRNRTKKRGVNAVLRAVSGLVGSGTHSSKLQSAVRNALTTLWRLARSRFAPRWMSRREERAMFADWDTIYRHIREHKLASGTALPMFGDSSDLHRRSAIPSIEREHQTVFTIIPMSPAVSTRA